MPPSPPNAREASIPGGLLGAADWQATLQALLRQWSAAGVSGQNQFALISRAVAEVDELITEQVNAILHHPVFQRLEASWRGLRYLVDEADVDRNRSVRIRVLDMSWKDLSRDVQRSVDASQTHLFRKVYDEEFGTAGGVPFGVLIGDYEIQHRPRSQQPVDDLDVLESVAHTAASAFAPFISGAAPALLGLDNHRQLERQIDLDKRFQGLEYLKWNDFRKQDDAKFVGLTLPKVLIRKPYGRCGASLMRRECSRCDQSLRGVATGKCPSCGHPFDPSRPSTYHHHRLGFRFQEHVSDVNGKDCLWANGAFAFAGVLIRTFIDHAWLADIRGFDHHGPKRGLVTGLPADDYGLDRPGSVFKMGTEVLIDGQQEKELSNHGFIALCHGQGTPCGVYYSNHSIYKPPDVGDSSEAVQGRVMSMLQYTFCVSRFAHYLKVMAREYIGSKTSAKQVENRLNDWVNRDYVTQDELANASVKAKCPLREAKVKVREVPDKPGEYRCQMKLWPHYQLDDLSVAVRLVTSLSGVGAGAG